MTSCNNQPKSGNIPNIDSLVDAKVEQKLDEANRQRIQEEERREKLIREEEKARDLDDDEDFEAADDVEDFDEDFQTEDGQVLKGRIGPYAITMHLDNLGSANKSDIVGHYYYNERPHSIFSLRMVSSVAINAKGSMQLVLNEYTSKGFHSGTFRGQYECRGDYYSGTFTNSKGEKFSFELY
jgi:hypothetical protein